LTEEKLTEYCPVCGIKNDGKWVYTCGKCWWIFTNWVRQKYPDSDRNYTEHLPEYLKTEAIKIREVVKFT
jgi:hypothetical protein